MLVPGQPQQRQQVADVAVHSTVRNQPDQVKRRVASPFHNGSQARVAVEPPCFYGSIDSGQILRDNPSGPQIQMADLAVTHLALGQADTSATGRQAGPGVARVETLHVGESGLGDGIPFPTVSPSPTIQDGQKDHGGCRHDSARQ